MTALAERKARVWWPPAVVADDDDAPADGERGRALVDTAKAIEGSGAEMWRGDMNLLFGSLYEGRALTNLYQFGGAATLAGDVTTFATGAADVTWNLIRSVVQTVASQVSRSRPRARFVTTGGNYKQKRRAKKLTTFTDGLFAECELYEKTQQVFTDAGVFDVGAIEVLRDNDRVRAERVLACEILIDSASIGSDGRQRTMYRRKFIDRDVLLATYGDTPEKRQAIIDAKAADPVMDGSSTNLVEAYEGWHLRSSKKAKDGFHVIAIDGNDGLLLEEAWTKDYFPILLFRMDPALAGPYGRSAADVLMGIQIAINTALDKIQRAQHLACVPRVAIQRGSKVTKSSVTNAMGSIIEYTGSAAPVFFTPTALSPEVYSHLEEHYRKGFALYGVNAQFAAGATDTGAAAIKVREDLDVQTARFAVLAQRWESFHMRIARVMVDIARDIYADNDEMRVSAPGTALLESIDWKDVDLEEDEYIVQAYPTSLLPQTPQGRIDRVRQLVADGIWDPKRAEAALDDLDIDSAMAGARSGEKLLEKMCDGMLDDGTYEPPEPWMDLATALRVAAEHIALGRMDGAPAKHLDLLYRFLDDVQVLKAASAPPAPIAPVPGAPMGGQAAPAQLAA